MICQRWFSYSWVVVLLLLLAGGAAAQNMTPTTSTWVTDGAVYAIARTASTVYLGGAFSYVGPNTGGGVPLSDASGVPAGAFPIVSGSVFATAADGAGGWYIGGAFTQVGSLARNNIAHIKANGSVDAGWNPGADDTVAALAVSGGTVYAGGSFTSIGGQARSCIAALDGATGSATAWNPTADGAVNTLTVAGTTVYAGGWFTSIGGQARNFIAALDAASGSATAWDPSADAEVHALAISGSTLYAGGSFTSIGGQTRGGIAALDAATGAATAWDPSANAAVRTLTLASASTIYAGGSFTSIGGQTRQYAAALDTSSGSALAWNPNADGVIQSLVAAGPTVYAAGNFTRIGGQTRHYLAALDTATGNADAWNPNPNDSVYTVAVAGSVVYAGGAFTSLGGQARSNLAALDANSGALTPWNPNADAEVYSLGVSGSKVYAGGAFGNIGGQVRNYLAALDAASGLATSWNPRPDGTVNALVATPYTVYVGGDFTNLGGQMRNHIAALDAATGTANVWDPQANATVNTLALTDTAIYAGGAFTGIGGQLRNHIAALDLDTALATGWNPNANLEVYNMVVSGGSVYACGGFTTIGGQARNTLAELSTATGLATVWNPNPNNAVYTLALYGSTVYAGGMFSAIGGQPRNHFAALDAATGGAQALNPNFNGEVRAIVATSSTIDIGGSFTTLNGRNQPYYALYVMDAQAPSGPSATTVHMTSITWNWLDNSANETGFKVWVDAGAGAPTTLRTTTAPDVTNWIQNGLTPNTPYSFQVASTVYFNDSARTDLLTTYTMIEPLSGLIFSNAGPTSIDVAPGNSLSNLAGGLSGIYFANTTFAVNSGWRQTASAWHCGGLTPNTYYNFTGKCRNGAGIERAPISASCYTLAAAPTVGLNVACDKTTGTFYGAGATFTFSNPAGFGSGTHGGAVGKVTEFRYAWDTATTHTFTGSESEWVLGMANPQFTVATASGNYYLHLQSLNGDGVATPQTLNYGPFKVDASLPAAPAAPVGPGPVILTTGVTFIWTAPADAGGSGLASYFLQIGTTPDGNDVFSGNVGLTLSRSFTGSYDVTYYARVRAIDGVGNAGAWSPSSVGVLVGRAPQITAQPGNQSLSPGGSATFAVTVTGSPTLVYQWKKNGTPLNNNGRITGVHTPTLSLNPAAAGDSGNYTCVVSNSVGTTESLAGHLTFTIPSGSPILTVASAFGTPNPAVGSHFYADGDTVNVSIGGSPDVDTTGTTRQICVGWTLRDDFGNLVDIGDTTSTSFIIDSTLTLEWQWAQQYKVTAEARPAVAGTITLDDGATPATGWYDGGTSITLRGTAAAGFALTRWAGAVVWGYPDDVALSVDGPKAVQGYFHPLLQPSARVGGNITPLGQYGGANYTAAMDARYAYIGEGARLSVLDISVTSEPLAVGSLLLPDIIRKITLKNGLIYVADGGSGLQIARLSASGTPTWLGGVDTPGQAMDVLVLGDTAYIADGILGGVQVADVSDPTAPKLIGASTKKVTALGLASQGAMLFVAGNGMQVFDVTAADKPVWKNECAPADNTSAVSVAQGKAYVATSKLGLKVWDVASPSSPTLVGLLTGLPHTADVVASGTLLCLAEQGGLHLIDSTFPDQMVELSKYPVTVNSPRVAMGRGLAIMSDATSGVSVFHIENPYTTPTLASRYVTHCVSPGVRGYSQGLKALSAYLYVTDWSRGLEVIDMNAYDNPLHLGSYSNPGGNAARGLAINGSNVFVADNNYGLISLNNSDPTSLTRVGSVVMNAAGVDVITTNGLNLACVANAVGGLNVIDATTMTFSHGTATGSASSRGVAVQGNLAYLADWNKGLRVLTVTTSTNPVISLTLPTSGQACGVALLGGRIFVADGDGGVRIFRLGSNPATSSTQIAVPGFATAVAPTAGGLLYVAAAGAGLQVYDLNTSVPQRIAYYPVPGGAYGVLAQDMTAFVAAGDGGVFVIHVDARTPMLTPTPTPTPTPIPTPTPTPIVVRNAVGHWRMYDR